MPRTKPAGRVECRQCHQWFDDWEGRPNRPAKYCSRGCRDAARSTRVTLTCVQCQESFQRKAYMEQWSQERGPFCSMACYASWQRQNIQGPTAPMWGHERNPTSRGSNLWFRNREAALARDGHQCTVCGSTKFLHVHHVIPWGPGQADPHALDNLATLCARHHREAHRALGGW